MGKALQEGAITDLFETNVVALESRYATLIETQPAVLRRSIELRVIQERRHNEVIAVLNQNLFGSPITAAH